VAKSLPSAEQVTLEHCGHIPQVERPQETNHLLLDFFTRVEAVQRSGRPPNSLSLDSERGRSSAKSRPATRLGPLDEAA
jgi:hypothetical protein